ncbi:unnamed protein product [Miscanthus lutarioriparius]|uniref:Xyloglucan endotransglucosylase/hydrolase n=1 Tax=Miscanthus lutarioriparius TaxID=422564 RepID=A0A811MD47_9POAL|nr:unnamed protein product [Miscanthus lutarioriparius]
MACSFLFLAFLAAAACLSAAAATGKLVPPSETSSLSLGEGYTQLFGDSNLALHGGGKRVHISLDERTGAGFASQAAYLHGSFSARIKLPADHTAGVVVAFYMSNGDVYERTHDELDFEFLGNVRGREWRVQTNVYGNGSTAVGREERYGLWFDPTEDFHRYAIHWSRHRIIFYVDDTPIREVVDYKYAPYVAEFADLELRGCAVGPATACATPGSGSASDGDAYGHAAAMSPARRSAMEAFRARYMTYGYCYDRLRYPAPLPECSVGAEAAAFLPSGDARAALHRHGRRNRMRRGADSAV